jgi:4-hydroxy-tetrahydrodipicolinate synthase
MARFEGNFSLLVTPFDAEGRIDAVGYGRLVDYHLAAQPQGIFAVCGTSEMAALTPDERFWLAGEAVRCVGGAVPVVATANVCSDPRDQLDEVARMSSSGVDGVVLVPPRQHDGSPDALFEYFSSLARRSAVPVLLYEWPACRPAHVPADVFGRLVREVGVRAVKDTTCTRSGIAAKVAAAPEATVFQANNPLLVEGFRQGARGTMTITSAARPDLLSALWRAHVGGRLQEVAALAREIVFLDGVLGPAHPAGAKWLLQRAGVLTWIGTRGGSVPSEAAIAALQAWAAGAPGTAGA